VFGVFARGLHFGSEWLLRHFRLLLGYLGWLFEGLWARVFWVVDKALWVVAMVFLLVVRWLQQ